MHHKFNIAMAALNIEVGPTLRGPEIIYPESSEWNTNLHFKFDCNFRNK